MHLRDRELALSSFDDKTNRIALAFPNFFVFLLSTHPRVERRKKKKEKPNKKLGGTSRFLKRLPHLVSHDRTRVLARVNGNFCSKGAVEITFRKTVKQIVKLICKPIKKLFRKDYDGEQK